MVIKKTLVLSFTLLFLNPLLKAQQSDFLSNTIVFKMKEQYSNKCFQNHIYLSEFQNFAQHILMDKLVKVFPQKQKTDKKIDLSLIYQLHYTKNISEQKVINLLYRLGIVKYAERYVIPQLCYTPNDTVLSNQWYITQINALNAWNINKGDTNIVIGITDTGWEPTHPDLIGNVKINYNDPLNGLDDDADGFIDNFMGWDVANNDGDALWESISHGVYVTGIAAATTDNVTGISGVGFNTKFLPVKISNSAGMLTHAYQGVVYAADHGCDIINCSWGSYSFSQFNKDVIDYAVKDKGCLIIGAVGNDNGENVFYPAAYSGVFSVAATEQSDLKKNNSNYGTYVDISAPGEAIWTTAPNGNYATNGGTSMAAPVVAGAAAIVKAQFPSYTNQQVRALLQATADDLDVLNPTYAGKLGSGRVDLFDALNASNPAFIELDSTYINDGNNQIFVTGDTLRIEATFINYLSALSGLSVTLSATSPYINIIDGVTNLPSLSTLQSYSNTADLFTVEILSGVPYNEPVTFKAKITNGTYTKNDYFTIFLNPDYINLEENQVATSITGNGKIGFNDVNNSVGLGFTYQSTPLLFEAGLMIGDATTRVADAVRNGASQDQDFGTVQNVQFNPPYVSAKDLYAILDDSPLSLPMDIAIEQFAYAFANTPDDKYVIVKYIITNTGNSTLSNLFVGIFADWDIDNALQNKANFDAARKMGYVYSLTNDTTYAAIKLLTNSSVNVYNMDLDGSNGIDPNGGGFTTEEKYNSLSTSKSSAGNLLGNDVAHTVSTGAFSLLPGNSITVAFAIIAGDSLSDIQASADAAQFTYNSVVGIDEFLSENNVVIAPNPTTGIINVQSISKINHIIITDIYGTQLKNNLSSPINLSSFAKGIYILKITTDQKVETHKVILVK